MVAHVRIVENAEGVTARIDVYPRCSTGRMKRQAGLGQIHRFMNVIHQAIDLLEWHYVSLTTVIHIHRVSANSDFSIASQQAAIVSFHS